MICKTERAVVASQKLRPAPIGIIVITGSDCCSAVGQFADACQVVARIEKVVGALLLALRKEAFVHRRSDSIPFFAEFFAAPEKTRVGGYDRILFLDDADAAAEAVVAELATVRAVVDGREAIFGVPFEGAGAVAGHVSVGVMGEALGRAGHRNLIGTRPRVA